MGMGDGVLECWIVMLCDESGAGCIHVFSLL